MELTKTITLETWEMVVSGASHNPMANSAILSMAARGEIVVTHHEKFFLPRGDGDKFLLREVVPASKLDRFLRLDNASARKLIIHANASPVMRWQHLLFEEPVYAADDVMDALKRHAERAGLDENQAALELGITRASFLAIATEIHFGADHRYLREFVEEFRSRYLPKNKTWSTRTSLVEEFVQRYNLHEVPAGKAALVVQYCEIAECRQAASDQCFNPTCRADLPPRFICPAHGNWIQTKQPIAFKPPSICSVCASRARGGELSYVVF